ncbi:MAG TPA: hypothetical protein VN641_16035 [Urbifossiella sp.]|nr:hypothetical protein [Urbifossiella sp.]
MNAIDKLGRFTPDGSGLDAAAVLFRAGQASARTPWGWKAAVAVLLLANGGWLAERWLREPVAAPIISVPETKVAPGVEPPVERGPSPTSGESLWSLGALQRTGDLELLPEMPAIANFAPTDPPLTLHSPGMID